MAKHKALSDNYPEPHHADGELLKVLREDLRIGQVELSKLAGIGQDMISRIESGARPFSKRARNKIWPVMEKLREQHVKGKKLSGLLSEIANPAENLEAVKAAFASLTIEQRLQLEKARLEGVLQGARETIADKDAQIATLIKALDAALQANADYAKLFALKGASVAADELQQEIQSRQRKHDDE